VGKPAHLGVIRSGDLRGVREEDNPTRVLADIRWVSQLEGKTHWWAWSAEPGGRTWVLGFTLKWAVGAYSRPVTSPEIKTWFAQPPSAGHSRAVAVARASGLTLLLMGADTQHSPCSGWLPPLVL